MRRSLALLATTVALASSPALALRVTNLDKVPHTISYEATGDVKQYPLAPNATVNLAGQPNGRLSLVTAPEPSNGGSVNADGMLSGIIGNGRNQNIPADQMDDYVIWPGGKLMLQRRMKQFDGR